MASIDGPRLRGKVKINLGKVRKWPSWLLKISKPLCMISYQDYKPLIWFLLSGQSRYIVRRVQNFTTLIFKSSIYHKIAFIYTEKGKQLLSGNRFNSKLHLWSPLECHRISLCHTKWFTWLTLQLVISKKQCVPFSL